MQKLNIHHQFAKTYHHDDAKNRCTPPKFNMEPENEGFQE